jgi:hypothetical protein
MKQTIANVLFGPVLIGLLAAAGLLLIGGDADVIMSLCVGSYIVGAVHRGIGPW